MEKRDSTYWESKKFACFTHTECEYYPCHKVPEGQRFNCLFCYCPLYMLGRECGGNYVYLENGIKDCSHCLVPHRPDSYGVIAGKFQEIVDAMARREREQQGREQEQK